MHVAGEGQQGRSDKLSWGACMLLPFLGLILAQASQESSLSTSSGCFQPNLELLPGKAEERRRAKPAVEAACGCSGDAVPYGAEHRLFPSKSSHGQGNGSQDFSAWSQTTLGHLGQVVHLNSSISLLQGGER